MAITRNDLFTGSCVQGRESPCARLCPIRLDVRGFVEKIKAGNFTAAYRIYAKASVFPAIVSTLCEETCKANCSLQLSLRALEQACIQHTQDRAPERYKLPFRKERVAIIGAGISGLACTYRLASKRYDVTLFDQAYEVGGRLASLLPESLYKNEIALTFAGIAYNRKLGMKIASLSVPDMFESDYYDAVYVATGAGGTDFGLMDGYDKETLMTTRPGFFIGGEITGVNAINALAQGLTAATSIESYLKTGGIGIRQNLDQKKTYQIKPHASIENLEAIRPANEKIGYTKDEATAEAERCLLCDCTRCYDTCVFMQEQNLMPRMIELKARNDVGPAAERIASKMIASCALCGHCEAVCTYRASVEKAMLNSKKKLFEADRFAYAYHDFYLQNMKNAVGSAYLCKPAPGRERASYVFFPGCQLGEANPLYVTEPYSYMLKHDDDTALMLSCCGAPALYAGDEKSMKEVLSKITGDLRKLCNPTIVYACASCAKIFAEYLPEIRIISLFEYMQEKGLPEQAVSYTHKFALFDPCASRNFPELQEAVRILLYNSKIQISELPENRHNALCCGHGGHIYAANPQLSQKFTLTATNQSQEPYMTYCTNCRDLFLAEGKAAVYMMDPLFAIENIRKPRHLSERAENRRIVSSSFVSSLCEKEATKSQYSCAPQQFSVLFSEKLLTKLDRLLIAETEIEDLIRSAEEAQCFFVNETKGTRIAHKKIGRITCWAEYETNGNNCHVINAYSHRIEFW